MAIPRFVRPFTKHVVSPLVRPIAGHAPWFGILTVRGRKTGRLISTPLNVFRHEGEYVFALTYGSDVQWLKNALAAGEADLQIRGRRVRITEPRVFRDEAGRAMPLPVRFLLTLMDVNEYLAMRPVKAD